MSSWGKHFATRIVSIVALASSLGLGLGLAQAQAQAQTYPDKTIHFVVPWPPGGAADIMARLIGEGIAKDLGQSVVVDAAMVNARLASLSTNEDLSRYIL